MAQKMANNMDNFARPLNIDKIFGMLEDLIGTNKATRHFFMENRPVMHVKKFSF